MEKETISIGSCPRVVTSRRSIRYKPSSWCVHEFEVWSGELVSRAALLRAGGAELVWVGGAGEQALGEVALGLPAGDGRGALCSALLGDGGAAAGLARRLAAGVTRPVYVCCGTSFDRFTAPLIERALVAEIKSRPNCI